LPIALAARGEGEVERKGSVGAAKLTYLRKRLGRGATLVKEKEGRSTADTAPRLPSRAGRNN